MKLEKTTCLAVLLTCLLLLANAVFAQEEEALAESQGSVAPAAAEPEAAPPEVAPPEAAPPFDVDAATAAYLARMSPEEKERSDSYFEGGYWLQLWGFLYGLAMAWLLLSTRLSARMRDLAKRVTPWRPVHTAAYAVQYVILTTLLAFPLTLYQGFFREHKYDLATQTLGEWLGDQAKGLGVGLILTPLLLIVLYGVFRRAVRTWWLWGSAVALLFLVFVMLIAPVYIAPLFNTYEALEDPAVVDPILSMARANGVAVDNVYQFDASRQSKRISANVSGFAGTMRISLNDNLLNRCTLPEVKAVMGHEIGHYVLNHVYESIVFIGVVLTVGFGFLRWSFALAMERWGERWGIQGIADVAGLPLLGALLSIYFFVATPVMNTYIRVNEAEADAFGLNAAREPEGFADTALKLSEYRKINPGPVEEWIFFDHPSGRARIHMAMQWKAEHLHELDEPLAAAELTIP